MSTKIKLVLAAATIALSACGGGGGGGSSPAPTGTPTPTTTTTLDSAAQAVAQLTTYTDTVAVTAGAQLLLDFESSGGTTNQFGGRSAGKSWADATDDLACGVYAVSSNDDAEGSALKTNTTGAYAVFCSLVYAESATTKYRHYIKLRKTGSTGSTTTFAVTTWADRMDPSTGVGVPSTWFLLQPGVVATLVVTVTSGTATHYDLDGALAQTYRDVNAFINDNGSTTVDLSGSITTSGANTILGFVGSANLLTQASASAWQKTYNSPSQVTVTRSGGDIVSLSLTAL